MKVSWPIYERTAGGAIRPNPLFHRPSDKLHSRCIEYPFAAACLQGAERILDVGTAKGGGPWIAWLESLPLEVHATDYDAPEAPFEKVIFHRADVRELPIADARFDQVLAVSVIEHIGLASPQVDSAQLPAVDDAGDLRAVEELARVLRPGGELVMTMPFGAREELILKDQARCYTAESLRKFDHALHPVRLEYYEYQHGDMAVRFQEYPRFESLATQLRRFFASAGGRLDRLRGRASAARPGRHGRPTAGGMAPDDAQGPVTWRRIPMASATATHRGHVDGVICGVWRKR